MIKRNRTRRSRKGMVMLMVLFIVMAIAVISSGFIARSDAALACGRNFCVRNETDYVAWSTLEIAWALVQDPNSVWSCTKEPVSWETMSDFYYDFDVTSTADPNIYTVNCSAYKEVGGQRRAESRISATLFYDSADPANSSYISISRQ